MITTVDPVMSCRTIVSSSCLTLVFGLALLVMVFGVFKDYSRKEARKNTWLLNSYLKKELIVSFNLVKAVPIITIAVTNCC